MTKPLKVEHLNARATDSRESLVSLCASALHMSKGEERLLQFYARQQDGFTPAAKRIMDETGLGKRQVYYARDMLEKHGVAKSHDGCFYIDWERIRLFSTLDPTMTSKDCYVAPVEVKKLHHKVTLSEAMKEKLLSCSMTELCELFAAMDEDMYQASVKYLKKVQA